MVFALVFSSVFLFAFTVPVAISQEEATTAEEAAAGGEESTAAQEATTEEGVPSAAEAGKEEKQPPAPTIKQIRAKDEIAEHIRKARIYYKNENYKKAIYEWEQAQALDPANKEIAGFIDAAKKKLAEGDQKAKGEKEKAKKEEEEADKMKSPPWLIDNWKVIPDNPRDYWPDEDWKLIDMDQSRRPMSDSR
jgi:tetratricopeptide (TPR) repeat protein